MEYLTLNNNTQMPLVGFGTFLLNGKTCGQGNRNEMYQEPVVLALAEKYNKTPAQILLRFLT